MEKLTPEEFADKVLEVIWPPLMELPEEERERRLAAFEQTVERVCTEKKEVI